MGDERIGREIDAAPCRMHRQGPHQAGQAVSEPRAGGGAVKRGTAPRRDTGRPRANIAPAVSREIGLERAPVGHDPGRDVEASGHRSASSMRSATKRDAASSAPKASATGWPAASPPRARSIASRHHCRRMAPSPGSLDLLGDAGKLDIEGAERKEIGRGPRAARTRRRGRGRDRRPARCALPCRPARPHARSARLNQIRRGPAAGPLPLAEAGAALHASRRTPRMSCSGEATKIDE